MKMNSYFKYAMLISIFPFSATLMANDNDDVPEEEKLIVLTDRTNNNTDIETLQVPATATLTGNLLNVNFTGAIPLATVAVTNTTTGITTSTSLPTVSGVTFTTPVTLGTNIVTVTNEQSGESVSGEFEVEEEE